MLLFQSLLLARPAMASNSVGLYQLSPCLMHLPRPPEVKQQKTLSVQVKGNFATSLKKKILKLLDKIAVISVRITKYADCSRVTTSIYNHGCDNDGHVQSSNSGSQKAAKITPPQERKVFIGQTPQI